MSPPKAQSTHSEGLVLRQIVMIALLIVGVVALHGLTHLQDATIDPTGLLALGFIVLASYTIGGLVEGIKLPHITGYLIAGLIFGPSLPGFFAQSVSSYELLPPFDRGVLNTDVIHQLSLFDTLAVALIALNAGGELKLEGLKRGFRAIFGVLSLQYVTVMVGITLLLVSMSGGYGIVVLPGFIPLPLITTIAIGAMVAAISFATSPAATLAVINETHATGPMSKTVLSTVVLKDVLVVVTFAVTQAIVASQLGATASEGGLAGELAQHIGGSMVGGALVGGVMALYLRYVNQEILLFLIGVIYVGTYATTAAELDPVLLFLTAGFTVSNFSKHGDRLIDSIEQLSLPVYVVFFTLAGAKLHLNELASVAPFAIALVVIRGFCIWLGVRGGARIGRADDGTKSYGWMGFLSQAGVSISLAAMVGSQFGEIGGQYAELGRALETLIIGGVALNELVGPVLLKAGLGLAGEISTTASTLPDAPLLSVKPPSIRPEPEGGEALEPWPENIGNQDLWGVPIVTKSDKLNTRTQELETDLQTLVRDVSTGPLRAFRVDAEKYLRDLRREFLRHHRRLTVQARSEEGSSDELVAMLRAAQADLAAHWRGIVLGRSITVNKETWSPEQLINSLDNVVEGLPKTIIVPYEERSYESQTAESMGVAIQRAALRFRRAWRKAFGQQEPARELPLYSLGRYHLYGKFPPKLESLAALFVEADRHLVARTRSIFDGVAGGYDALVRLTSNPEADTEKQLVALREDFEAELALALEEVRRITRDGTQRTASALSSAFSAMKSDLPIFGTLDLPLSRRRSSRVFTQRVRAMEMLGTQLVGLRHASSAGYSMLAMELELLGLEARIKEAVEDHATRIQNMVKRRALAQIERVDDALQEALQHVEEELQAEYTGEQLAIALRRLTELTSKVTGEAARVTAQLHTELSDESKVTPLLDALIESCRSLTPRYRLIMGQQLSGEWRLPSALPEVDVPFREIVLTYIESKAAPKLLHAARHLAMAIRPLASTLQELERLIAFNVELATAELEVVHDQPVPDNMYKLLREMIPGQLERSEATLSEFRQNAEESYETLTEEMQDAVLGTLEDLRKDLAEGSFSRARLEAMRRAASGKRLLETSESIPNRIEKIKQQVGNGLRAFVGDERLEIWRHKLGLAATTTTDEITAGAFEAPKESADLPLVYRRLFAADTMEAGDVLMGRDKEIAHAESVLSSNIKDRLRSVALVGVDGVGKAAVASAVVRGGRWKNVRHLSFSEPIGIEEVEALFQESPEGQLVVVNGLHWLISMEPGGFEPLRRFVSGIIAEGGRRRWLAHANVLFWNFASTIAPLRDAFPEVIHLGPLDADALQAAVIARHRLSGYGHSFDRREGDSRIEGFIARSASRIRRPYDQYFQELHRATGGLVRDALRLWLASIRSIADGDVVSVGAVPSSDYARLNRLPEDVLVNLYQISRQGWMNAAGQARLFRIDESTAQAQLSRFAHLGLLREKDKTYRIAVHLRGALGRIYLERGWTK